MKIHQVEQGSPEWHELRKGRMTASHADAIGANGKGLKTYITTLMAKYYSSADPDNYTNAHMDRGNQLEPQARAMYELDRGVDVEQVGFVEIDEHIGCSPDGLIGDDGGLEIKCHDDKRHFELIITDKIESKYLWQIQMNLMLTGRKWWDYVAYNPNFERSLVIHRIKPDKKMFAALEKGFEKGKELIKELKETYAKI